MTTALTPRRFGRRTFAAATVALSAMLAATGCGSDEAKKNDTTTAADTGTGSETTGAAPDKVVIGYQLIPNGDLVVKNQGWLEELYPDTEIEWKQFDSGGSVNEAFLAGAIDIGLAGSSPVSRGLSNGIEYIVPWIHDVIGEAEALVVTDDIADIAGLKGKTVATPFASTAHYSLLAALEEGGLTAEDVDIVDMEPADILSAWQGGNLDGAYVWNPTLAELKADGGKVLISSADLAEKGTTTYDLAVVGKSFADEYPDFVTAWVGQQSRAVELYRDDEAAWAEAVAAELEITADDAIAQSKDLIYLTAEEQAGPDYLGGGLPKNLFAAATFNFDQGQIDEVKDESFYTDSVLKTFAENASK